MYAIIGNRGKRKNNIRRRQKKLKHKIRERNTAKQNTGILLGRYPNEDPEQ